MTWMTSRQLAEGRQRIGWSQEQLARAVDVPVDRVREWEAATVPVPRRAAWHIEEKLAWAEYEAGVRRAGIPVCEWAEAWDATPFPADDEGMLKSLEELQAHEKECPVCIARQRYAERHPPPAARRRHLWLPPAWTIADQVDRLPEKLRPVAWGVLAGVLGVLAVAFHDLGNASSAHRLTAALQALGIGILGGAAGGTAYLVARPLRTRLHGAGPYVVGVVCTTAFLGVTLLLSHLAGGTTPRAAEAWALVAVANLVLGICMGYAWFRPGRRG
ncbi:MAG: helix-turn-helix transcriptional regulator [Gemmatimonadetes bacterium]|nr:helix-turn-helix transcriptional regulator [Gemmatimonadota bacterium]